MKKYSILITSLLFSFGVFAQSNTDTITSNRLHFAYGQVYNLKIDKTYSRLAKNGFNHFIDLGYHKINSNRIIDINGSFMIGTLKTKGNTVNIINDYAGNIQFRYLKNIQKLSKNNLSVYIGGNLGFRGDIWFPKGSELRYGWDINLGTGLATSIIYKINSKFSMQYDLDVPLIGVLWRSHNNGQQLVTEEIQLEKGLLTSSFETPRFSHFFNTLYLDNSVKLFYNVSNKIDLYYNLGLSYRYIKEPLVKKGYEINNSLGIIYKF